MMLTSRENDLNLVNVLSCIWGALCISQCNEMLVPQATANNQGSIQHRTREDVHRGVWADSEGLSLALNGHMVKNQSLCSKSSRVCLICSSVALCDPWVCAGGRDSGGLLTNHCITVLDSKVSHFKKSPSLQALKIPAHLQINTYYIYNFLL